MEIRREICRNINILKMSEANKNILPTAVLGTILFGIIYIVLFTNDVYSEGIIKMVEIKNNRLLSAEDYLAFTNINNSVMIEEIPLPIIKTRFAKHPYIKTTDVLRSGSEKVEINITEKNIAALILKNGNSFFITDEFQILSVLTNTQLLAFPVITNLKDEKKIIPGTIYRTDEIVEAFKIIEAARLTNENIASKLSEINFRNGGDIILRFSGIDCPVIFGRNEEAKKMVYLDIMWNEMHDSKKIFIESNYIDLRFSNDIYVAKSMGNVE